MKAILEIDMPTQCMFCPCYDGECCRALLGLLHKEYYPPEKGRHELCPLKNVGQAGD